LVLPTDGQLVQTRRSLDPARQYRVTITSAFNLRPFLVDCSYHDRVRRTFFGSVQHYDPYTLCTPPILFNGHQLPTSRFRDSERGSYYLQTTETDFYIPTLDFYHWGTGAPLTLRTAYNLSDKVRTAVVTIVDVTWEEQQQQEQREREEARERAIRQEREATAQAEAQARVERARQEAERQQQMQQEREEADRQARERLASRLRTSVVAGAFGIFVLFLWWLIGTSDRRRAARLEREEQEAAAAAKARARAHKEEAERRAAEEQWKQERQKLRPAEVWRSSAPIPRGVQVAVQIEGTYSYVASTRQGQQHTDGHYGWSSGTHPGSYRPHKALFFDASTEPAMPFFENRPLHLYRFLYIGTGTHMEVFLRRHPAFSYYNDQNPHLTLSIAPLTVADQEIFRAEQEAEERRKAAERECEQQAAAAERAREAEEEQRRREEAHRAWQEEQRRIQAQYDWLCEQHDYAELACFEDIKFIEGYAAKHRQDLLAHRDDITKEYESFHQHCPEAVQRFRTEQPQLYVRAWPVFRWRCYAAAVRLFVEEPPPPPQEKPPEPPPESPKETKARLAAEARAREELRVFREDLRDGELFRNLDRLGAKKQRLDELKKQYPNLQVEIDHLGRQFSRAAAPRQQPASPEEPPRDTSTRPRERY
jgi:uncharacterized protein YdaU (DUF1376 family)